MDDSRGEKVLVIPDIHLKPWIFDQAEDILIAGKADRAVCLMDIADDWGMEFMVSQYAATYDRAIIFAREHPNTLWCYGNHDLSYMWIQPESGFSSYAISTVNSKLAELRNTLEDDSRMAYVHRIDNVLFLHGGLTHGFVMRFASDIEYKDTDAVLERINSLGFREMWDDASPIWHRPQYDKEKLYREKDLLQVVGHTPVTKIEKTGNVLSCDLFSTYKNGDPIGTKEFILIDTETLEYMGIR
jgi:hypothetical protein